MNNLNSAAKVGKVSETAKCCKIEGCTDLGQFDKNRGKHYFKKGFCKKHYARFIRHSDPQIVKNIIGENRKENPLYAIYNGMLSRCNNVNNKKYKNYGGRGIKVCIEWSGIDGFASFCEDMGQRCDNKMTLDRINVNGNYEPKNCRWCTMSQQQSNKTNSNKTVGVCYSNRDNNWIANMILNGKQVFRKYFKTESEAINARYEAEIKYFGKLISEM